MTEKKYFDDNKNYELVVTEDGSPTLRDLRGTNLETMHHRGGAYSETQEIYGKLVRYCLDKKWYSFVSVGLGLGYNELLVATEVIRAQVDPSLIQLRSFEADTILKEAFQNFVSEEITRFKIYNDVLERFEKDSCKVLNQWLKSGQWKIDGILTDSTAWDFRYHGIMFDAYSSKTSPELWGEEFLKSFFSMACCSEAVVSTYACTGNLKRALATNGFKVEQLLGFHNKRNSTFAVRE